MIKYLISSQPSISQLYFSEYKWKVNLEWLRNLFIFFKVSKINGKTEKDDKWSYTVCKGKKCILIFVFCVILCFSTHFLCLYAVSFFLHNAYWTYSCWLDWQMFMLCYVSLDGGTEERENSERNKEKVSLKKKIYWFFFFLLFRCILHVHPYIFTCSS